MKQPDSKTENQAQIKALQEQLKKASNESLKKAIAEKIAILKQGKTVTK